LTASAGVSYNKFLAKLASDRNKPDGLCLILPEQGKGIIAELPIGGFHGIGKATEAKMKALGVHCGSDLGRISLETLIQHFGKAGEHYYRIARGIDERLVNPNRPRKSWGAETTFQIDLSDKGEMLGHLVRQAGGVLQKLTQKGFQAYGVTVKVKYDNFEQVTRARSLGRLIGEPMDISHHLAELLDRTEAGERKVRLLGVSFSVAEKINSPKDGQLDLFGSG
ncbi:MAG: DNA polymerase thumb domain-containing protein, partial [Candidatus Methylumidiphilus sp.]